MVVSSCMNSASKNSLELSCESIAQLMESDQHLRMTKLKDPFLSNVDSLMIVNGFPGGLDKLSSLSSELRDSIWKLAKAELKPFTSKQKEAKDSIWKIQRNIDSLNTLKVIGQIQHFGIDSLNEIDSKCGQNSLIIFVHTPEGLHSKVSEIINLNTEKIGENRMQHINWHLGGRVRLD